MSQDRFEPFAANADRQEPPEKATANRWRPFLRSGTPGQEASAIARRKAIYLEIYPETAAGVAGGLARQGRGSIRADGRKIHPAYLVEVKSPEESKGPWDYYKLVSTIPAEEAFRPLAESECPLIRAANK